MLIIVESPAKAKTISKIVGNKYVVKASVGHIRSLSDSKKTDDGRSLEINGIDIENDFEPIYVIDPDKKNIVSELKKLAKSEKNEILFATDSDREGEAISWHLAKVLGVKDFSGIKRLEFHEITKKAIESALQNPRPLNSPLVFAQQARQVLDKLVGYKLSPVLWKTMGNYRLSAGRVQSPALKIVVDREKEITAFKPEEYWEINGLFSLQNKQKLVWNWLDWPGDETNQSLDLDQITARDRQKELENTDLYLALTKIAGKAVPKTISSKSQVETLLGQIQENTEFFVSSITKKNYKVNTKPPFITSTLQQSASSSLGYPPKTTMRIAQKLYEGVDIDGEPTALITYMRTDSFNLSQESIETARNWISKNYPKALPESPRYYKSKSRNSQEAHEAIRPTDPSRTPQSLAGKIDAQMLKLYDLIWKRMVASQMLDEEKESVTFTVDNSQKDQFLGVISWTVKPGFKILTNPKSIQRPVDNLWITEKNPLFLAELFNRQKFTQPPSRYSPASLIKKMEELGIGRPSTYASIISTLQDRQYVETLGASLKPTSLGTSIADLLTDHFEKVTSSEMTAEMEENLDKISRGEETYLNVLRSFWSGFKPLVENTTNSLLPEDKKKYRETETDITDPKTGDKMVLKMGRFGEYYQNPQQPENMYPKNFREVEVELLRAKNEVGDKINGLKCEDCGKDLIVRVSNSSVRPYVACPDYRVGNKHTIVNFQKIVDPEGWAEKESKRKKYPARAPNPKNSTDPSKSTNNKNSTGKTKTKFSTKTKKTVKSKKSSKPKASLK